jgi:hypothetical protein
MGIASGWCWPSIIYLVVFVIMLIVGYVNISRIPAVVGRTLSAWIFYWSYLLIGLGIFLWLYGLCSIGQVNSAWFLIILLLVLYLLFWFLGYLTR